MSVPNPCLLKKKKRVLKKPDKTIRLKMYSREPKTGQSSIPRTNWEHLTTSVCGWSIVISNPANQIEDSNEKKQPGQKRNARNRTRLILRRGGEYRSFPTHPVSVTLPFLVLQVPVPAAGMPGKERRIIQSRGRWQNWTTWTEAVVIQNPPPPQRKGVTASCPRPRGALTLLLVSRAGSCGFIQAWAILTTCSSFLGCSSTLAARNNVVCEIIWRERERGGGVRRSPVFTAGRVGRRDVTTCSYSHSYGIWWRSGSYKTCACTLWRCWWSAESWSRRKSQGTTKRKGGGTM